MRTVLWYECVNFEGISAGALVQSQMNAQHETLERRRRAGIPSPLRRSLIAAVAVIAMLAMVLPRWSRGAPDGATHERMEKQALEEASHANAIDSAWQQVALFASDAGSVAVPPAATTPDTDPEWATFVRTDERTFTHLVTRPNSIRAAALFRNLQLNPRDTYLAASTRNMLGVAMEPCRTDLARVLDGFAAFVSQELDDVVKSGRCRVLTMDSLTQDEVHRVTGIRRDLDILKRQRRIEPSSGLSQPSAPTVSDLEVLVRLAVDAGMPYRVIDGRVRIVDRSQLTRSAAQATLIRELMRTHAAGVTGWFMHQGALSAGEANELLKQVDVEVEKALSLLAGG